MAAALDTLLNSLDLKRVGGEVFSGVSSGEGQSRAFGGHLAGQALIAAGRTVERGVVHALHTWFLHPGTAGAPVTYKVARLGDGRSFCSRQVVATQGSHVIVTALASFHVPEPAGPHHQLPMPAVPAAESLPSFHDRMAPYRERLPEWYLLPRPVDVRFVSPSPFERRPGEIGPAVALVWLRADGPLPDDPLIQAAVMAYASDLTLADTIRSRHGISGWCRDKMRMATLNHALWFHRPFRVDDWLLYRQESPSAQSGLGLARGSIFTLAGEQAASVVQECLSRPATASE